MHSNDSLLKASAHYHLMPFQVWFLLKILITPIPELLLVTAVNKDTHL